MLYYRCLISQLFDVSCQSTIEQMEQKEEIMIPWGKGIVGYVAQSGESVNIPDCYQVCIKFFYLFIECYLIYNIILNIS